MPLIGRIAAATARAYGLFSSIAQAVDPYFNYVVALLHGDGTNGGQNNTFLDSSTNNFTITRNGNTTQGSFSPFSQTGWGNYFDGTGDYLTAGSSISLSSSFTIEGWVYISSTAATSYLFGLGDDSTSTGLCIFISTTGQPRMLAGGSYLVSGSAGQVPANQWVHIALVRNSTSLTLYVNGTSVGTGTSSATYSGTAYVGAENYASTIYSTAAEYLSNVRVTTSAVYTANFTVPTTPLTAISGTSLLTCQSNRFLDASTNNFTITRNGDVSVQPFSPFNPTTAYSTSSIGGSGYFDGSGDYLTAAGSTSLTFGTGDFTVEGWFYTASPATNMGLFQISTTAGGLEAGNTNNVAVYCNSSVLGVYYNDTFKAGTTAIRGSAWTHFALVRSSGTDKLYVNGVADSGFGSSADTRNYTGGNIAVGGYFSTSYLWNGYISGFRVVKGTAVYTTDFTPPTAPPTAISNTQLLTNFTNGAIFDNAAVADYETVGNAQISTSVKKYGTGSMSFDGTGDYLLTDAPSTNLFVFGTGDFTIECWVYFNAVNATQVIYDTRPASTDGAYNTIYLNSSGNIIYYTQTADRITGPVLSASVWYHVAVCRIASQTKLFLNGTQVGSTYADTNSYVVATQRPVIGGNGSNLAVSYLNAYVDDIRITKGIGRYAYSFTPPTAALPDIGGTVTLTADPYYEYTTLLLPGNGTNGAQNNTFLDSSTNAFTITRNGNTTQGTFSPFSQTGWSNYFDGTGDYLSVANNAAFQFSTGDFTVEAWVFINSAPASDARVYSYQVIGSTSVVIKVAIDSNRKLACFLRGTGGSGATTYTSSSTIPIGQWTHIAFTRSGTTGRIFVNGLLDQTQTGQSQDLTASVSAYVGTLDGSSDMFTGYISNIRVVKGTAVYTDSFTPSTTPLTAITNTSLLTCQSNRFIDNSTNAFTITRNGDVSVQAFSPFNPTASWSAATYGGSGYFDGSGDYLTATNDTAINPGTGDFTLECWVYATGAVTNDSVFEGSQNGLVLAFNASSQLAVAQSNVAYIVNDTVAFTLNEWVHVAVVRSGTTLSLFKNGSRVATATNSTNFVTSTENRIGRSAGTEYFTGYISNLRFVKGTAVYSPSSTTLSVPTAPVTAISGTGLLLNCTNAAIYDATSKNDLETVGNAQISTTQSKFGGSSMYFDGSGDYLYKPSDAITSVSGDFTIEAWVYRNTNTTHPIVNVGDYALSTGILFYINNSNALAVYTNNAALISGGTISATTWTHVAVVRYGSTVSLYVNGFSVGTPASNTASFSGRLQVGADFYSSVVTNYLNGYIDDLRITKGIARYTSNFTPPTSAFLTL